MKRALLFTLILMSYVLTQAKPLPKTSPERNFEAFWHIFNQHYAHFENRKLDWNEQYQRFRPKVNPNTTDEELLKLLNQMVAPLKDGHVVISPTGDLPASAQYSPFYQEFPTKEVQNQFHQVTLANLHRQGFGPFTKFKSESYQIGGYCRSKDVGYLQLNGFGGMPLKAFTKQLDEMILAFADVKGLIIDIRINGGGSPDYLYELIGRLTPVKRLVGFGRTRVGKSRVGKPDQEYTPWGAYYVSPHGEKQLIKPTVLLTSGATISAGDHCALYLKQWPNVKLIGENTNGIFSPMFGQTLPNGWEVSLSNGQTVSAQRISYEGKGVPVDVAVTHHRSQMQQGIDPGLEKALTFLQDHQDELAQHARCYEQLALDFYAERLLTSKTYGDVTAYSTGLVEEDATLLAPFAQKCALLEKQPGLESIQERIRAEHAADSSFYQQNVKRRFYVRIPEGIRHRMQWPFVKRNARRLTIAHHISVGDRKFVRLHLIQGVGKGETVLIVFNQAGHVVEHCALHYNFQNSPFYW